MVPALHSGGNGLRKEQADLISVLVLNSVNLKLAAQKELLSTRLKFLTTQTDKKNLLQKINYNEN